MMLKNDDSPKSPKRPSTTTPRPKPTSGDHYQKGDNLPTPKGGGHGSAVKVIIPKD